MISIVRIQSNDIRFIELTELLDEELKERDGPENEFYAQFNHTDSLDHCLIVLDNNQPIGCGALKTFDTNSLEVKRMYVLNDHRNKGIAGAILKELEVWAKELGYNRCVLETGKRQVEAIALYSKKGYQIIENFEPYTQIENSICFEKLLN